MIPIIAGAFGKVPKSLEKKRREMEFREKNRNRIVEISYNTEKSPEDQQRCAVTQNTVNFGVDNLQEAK